MLSALYSHLLNTYLWDTASRIHSTKGMDVNLDNQKNNNDIPFLLRHNNCILYHYTSSILVFQNIQDSYG